MNDKYSTILTKHETDDTSQSQKETSIISTIKNEFSNSDEILNLADKLSITLEQLFTSDFIDFPITPIRTSDTFYVKKHTLSQIPYFHSHDFYELIYVHKGRSTNIFKPRDELLLTEKQCLLIPPDTAHMIGRSGKNDVILKVVIPREIFMRTGGKILSCASLNSINVFNNVSETAEFAMLKLLSHRSDKSEVSDIVCESYLNIFFSELITSKGADIAIEAELNAYFSKNIKSASLSDFSFRKNYNSNYVSRLIRAKTGKSFSEALNSYRMDRAKVLLQSTSAPIENIAFEVGYSNTSGFYKQFCSSFGITPSEYRNIIK